MRVFVFGGWVGGGGWCRKVLQWSVIGVQCCCSFYTCCMVGFMFALGVLNVGMSLRVFTSVDSLTLSLTSSPSSTL